MYNDCPATREQVRGGKCTNRFIYQLGIYRYISMKLTVVLTHLFKAIDGSLKGEAICTHTCISLRLLSRSCIVLCHTCTHAAKRASRCAPIAVHSTLYRTSYAHRDHTVCYAYYASLCVHFFLQPLEPTCGA